MKQRTLWMLALSAALVSQAAAQQFVYPAKGQSPQQQKSDEAECYTWAVQQSGVDPAKPQPQPQAAAPPTTAPRAAPRAPEPGVAPVAVVGGAAACCCGCGFAGSTPDCWTAHV